MKKTCPKCQAELFRVAKVCPCGHQFSKGKAKAKAKRKEKTVELVTPDPDFACGPTSDGGLMLFWPKRNESYLLTKIERDLVSQVLASLPAPQ